VVDLLDRAIEDGDTIAAALDVEGQVLAHNGQANQSNIAACIHVDQLPSYVSRQSAK
jgi:hypothetical protein